MKDKSTGSKHRITSYFITDRFSIIFLLKNRLSFIGLCILSFLIVLAVFAPYIAPYDPDSYSGPSFSPPNWDHLLGTNDVGQDILSELFFGARISLVVGILSATIGIAMGSLIGIISGSSPGIVDTTLMRIVDLLLAIPFIPLMIVIGVYFGPGLFTEIIVISGLIWSISAREVRSKVMSIIKQNHILAAKSMGSTQFYIMFHYLLPGVFPIVISQFVRAVSIAILLETSLSFLGLGDASAKSWGTMLFFANAKSAFLTDAWIWWILPSGLLITLTVLSFAFIGYSLEERIKPQLHNWGKNTKNNRTILKSSNYSLSISKERKQDEYNQVLQIRGLTVTYFTNNNVKKALDNIHFEVSKGHITGIIGESGSGKSTLAASIIGMLKPPAKIVDGDITILNQNLAKLDRSKLRQIRGNRIALIPQNSMSALNPVFTAIRQVIESILIHKNISKSEATSKAYRLLQEVGISKESANMYPHELSGGMRQRVLIAMALANEPEIIIADEPTTGLDIILQREILDILSNLRNLHGLSIVLITHDIQIALNMADEIVVMQNGKIVEKNSVSQLLSHQEHRYTHSLITALPDLVTNQGKLINTDKIQMTKYSKYNITDKTNTKVENNPVIQFSQVKKSFMGQRNGSSNPVLNDINFTISKREIVGLIGSSGVGKSTIAKLVVGLLNPDSGDIIFDGEIISKIPSSKRRKISKYLHLIFQDPYDSMPPHMNISQIVQEPLMIHRLGTKYERDRWTREVLEKVSLVPSSNFINRYPHELSGGERQRVALARALILKPKLIIADEPTTMLDAPLRLELLDLLKSFRDNYGISILYITHDISLASTLCDRLLVLHEGKIVDEGQTWELISHPNHYFSSMLINAAKTVRRVKSNVT